MTRRWRLAAALAALVSTAPLAYGEPLRAAGVVKLTDTRILLFPASVEVYEIVAGGQPTLKQDWTQTARDHLKTALETELTEKKATLLSYRDPQTPERQFKHVQIVKVHALVSQAILRHRYGGDAQRLPNKAGRFDWTLGSGASALREDHDDADYALFVHFVEGHSSGGRVAMNVAAAVFGGMVVTGRQTGLASLLDLRTGDVVWYNRNVESDGDLRTLDDARKAVRRLLKELPF
jgi:hypothetical protein